MRTRFGTLATAVVLASTSTTALAQAGGWRVSETSGEVTIRHGTAARPAARGAVLAPGDTVATGAGGRAVLVHDRDFVTVSRNSRVSVPAAEAQATGLVKLIQDLGNAVFKIEKLGVPHFGVNTPYLAAVVKGTTFSVTVDPASGTSLQVTEGAVEVATLDGGARDLIRPGGVATIAAGDLLRLHVSGDQERTIDSPAHPAETSSSDAETPATATTGEAAASTPIVAAASAPVSPVADTIVVASIAEAIVSKPVDLAQATGGFIAGSVAAAPAIVAAVRADLAVPPPPTPETPPTATSPVDVATVSDAATPVVTTPVAAVPTLAPVATIPSPPTETALTPAPSPPAETPAIAAPSPVPDVPAPVVTAPVVTAPVVTAPVVIAPVVTAPVIAEPVVIAPVVTAPPPAVVPSPPVTAPDAAPPAMPAPAPVVVAPPTPAIVVMPPVPTIPTPVVPPVVVAPPVVPAIVVVPSPVIAVPSPIGKDSPLDHDNGKGNDDKSNSGKGSNNSGSGGSGGSSGSGGGGSGDSGSNSGSGSGVFGTIVNTANGIVKGVLRPGK